MSELPLMLKMQAYERLITFTDRCGFDALMDRFPAGSLDASQLLAVFRQGIKTEFEHNISQQIYVPDGIWQAVTDMKEQQLFILGQLTNAMPADAPGIHLELAIRHFQQADPQASMQPMVLEAIRHAAKQALNSQ